MDLGELYEAESVGMRAALPPAHSFQSYVEAQNKPGEIQKAQKRREYWKAQFAAPIEPLELPLDFLRKPVKSYAAERQRRRYRMRSIVMFPAWLRGTGAPSMPCCSPPCRC